MGLRDQERARGGDDCCVNGCFCFVVTPLPVQGSTADASAANTPIDVEDLFTAPSISKSS